MSGNDNYPEGVTNADIDRHFGDTELQDAYRQYRAECRADDELPLPYQLWLAEYVESLR